VAVVVAEVMEVGATTEAQGVFLVMVPGRLAVEGAVMAAARVVVRAAAATPGSGAAQTAQAQ
jgi:hypothetical protein